MPVSLIPVEFDPFAPERYADFRRSENVEDRRKEKFGSFPQALQMPNIFWDPTFGSQNMMGLGPDDFDAKGSAAVSQLGRDAGAQIMEDSIQKYLSDRAPKLVPVDHDPFEGQP